MSSLILVIPIPESWKFLAGGGGAVRNGRLFIDTGGRGATLAGTGPSLCIGVWPCCLGTGGGALGFSKDDSVVGGKRGLAGGLIIGDMAPYDCIPLYAAFCESRSRAFAFSNLPQTSSLLGRATVSL